MSRAHPQSVKPYIYIYIYIYNVYTVNMEMFVWTIDPGKIKVKRGAQSMPEARQC